MSTALWSTYNSLLNGGDTGGCWRVFGWRSGESGPFNTPVTLGIQGFVTSSYGLFDQLPGGYNPTITFWGNGPGDYALLYEGCSTCNDSVIVIWRVDECCNATVVINSTQLNCTYTSRMEHPINGGNSYSFQNPVTNSFLRSGQHRCRVSSNCLGTISSIVVNQNWKACSFWEWNNLQVGDIGGYVHVTKDDFPGPTWVQLSLDSGVSYNGSNGAAFAASIESQAYASASAAGIASNLLDFHAMFIDGSLIIVVGNRFSSNEEYYFTSTSNTTFDNSSLINRGGGGVSGNPFNNINFVVPWPLQQAPVLPAALITCGNYTTPCGQLLDLDANGVNVSVVFSNLGNNAFHQTDPAITSATIINNEVNEQCTIVELTAQLSDCTGSPLYEWYHSSDPVNPEFFTAQINVAVGSGEWTVKVSGCNGCDIIEESITV